MHFGCAWYPEHWPEERWAIDLRLMRQAGMNVVRVGEFAWSRLETADGCFDLEWLGRAVNLAAAHGLNVVLGTPSAAPPAWLTHAQPQVLPEDAAGHRAHHGARCHYRATSQVYRDFCTRIAGKLAQRFGRHQAVIGWQIDNEFWRISYDTKSLEAFRSWLRERHGDLTTLNEAWSTPYWSQEYTAWDQIPAPTGTHHDNPGFGLAWRCFWSEVYADFQRAQLEAMHPHLDPRQWITHNFHPHDDLDRVPIATDLDLISWDAYIHRSETLDVAQDGADCDRMRCLKGRNFWVMETQPGSVNWRPVNTMMAPGAMRAYAWHLVGHGADAVLYWQWRSAPGGQEQYHGSVVGPDGEPRPRYDEIALIGDELSRCTPQLRDTTPVNRIALIDAWQDRWPLRWQPHHRDFDQVDHTSSWYGALQRRGLGCDVLEQVAALDGYDLVLAPHLHQIDAATAATLRAFVERGGHLALGPRSGFKTTDNRLATMPQPAHLADLLGGRVRDHYALDHPVPVTGGMGTGEARLFAEDLEAGEHCNVWWHYGETAGWLAGRPAVLHRRLTGGGGITYCGAWLDDILMDALMTACLLPLGMTGPLGVPPAAVEVLVRQGPHHRVIIAINHGDSPRTLPLPEHLHDLMADAPCAEAIVLAPQAVAVLADRQDVPP